LKRTVPLCLVFAACHTGTDLNEVPSFVVPGSVTSMPYDGNNDDLLTGGLGALGLTGSGPTFVDPAAPTAAELRKRAIYVNYRALVDISTNGGYGTLYGPNVDVNGTPSSRKARSRVKSGSPTTTTGRAGERDDDGAGPVELRPGQALHRHGDLLGIARRLRRDCYRGEWGLKNGCAVAYTDKGSGMGVHDLQNNTVNRIDGTRQGATDAGTSSNFTAT